MKMLLCLSVLAAGCATSPDVQPVVTPSAVVSKVVVFSGGNARRPLMKILDRFERQTGRRADYRSGGSGQVLAEALKNRDCDLYVAADLRHVRALERDDLVAAKLPVGFLRPALVVAKGNPKSIRGLEDLRNPALRVFLEPPDGCQLETATRQLLARNGVSLPGGKTQQGSPQPTRRTVAESIKAGTVDAAILWDSSARKLAAKGQVDIVAIPDDRNITVNIVVVQLRFAPHPDLARRLMLFMAGPRARAAWSQGGFTTFPEPPEP